MDPLHNPNTVADFLNTKDPDGNPCPITPMNSFWVNKLRALALEGVDLVSLSTRHKRQQQAKIAREAQVAKRAKKEEALRKQRIEEAKKRMEQEEIEKAAAAEREAESAQ